MARRGFAIIFTFLGVAFFISIVGFAALYFLFGREPAVPANATLVLRVGGDLAEVAPADVVGYLRGVRTPTVRSIVDNLRKAKVDSRVRAVLLKPTGFESPFWGKVQEIRDAVLDFKKSGKPIYAYLEYGGDREYYLATAADKVFLMPSASLDLERRRDLRGVPARHARQDRRVSRSAPHRRLQDVRRTRSPRRASRRAHKEMDESLNRDLYEQIVRGIADGRKKNEADVRRADRRRAVPARRRAARRAWSTMSQYEDQVDDKLRGGAAGTRHIDGDDYARVSLGSLGLNRGPRIAVIYAAGDDQRRQERLRSGQRRRSIGSDTLIDYIRQARHDASIRAIVLRIDSPGGSATASDAIWRELMIAQRRARRSADRRVDVGPRRVGRLLHRACRRR